MKLPFSRRNLACCCCLLSLAAALGAGVLTATSWCWGSRGTGSITRCPGQPRTTRVQCSNTSHIPQKTTLKKQNKYHPFPYRSLSLRAPSRALPKQSIILVSLHPFCLPFSVANRRLGAWPQAGAHHPGASQEGFVLPAFPPWSPLSPSFQDACRDTPQNSSVVCHRPKGTGEQQWKPGSQRVLKTSLAEVGPDTDTCGSCSLKPSPGDHTAPCHGETPSSCPCEPKGQTSPGVGTSHFLRVSQPLPPGQGRAMAT